MGSDHRRNAMGWVCLIALLLGFGLFTQMIHEQFSNEFQDQTPIAQQAEPRPPIVWEKGPGQSWLQLHDGQTYDGRIEGIQKPDPKRKLPGMVIIREPDIVRPDGGRRLGTRRTVLFKDLKKVHQGAEDKLHGKRCVFSLRGGKTVEARLLQVTERGEYEVMLVTNGHVTRLKKSDVMSVHQFDDKKH